MAINATTKFKFATSIGLDFPRVLVEPATKQEYTENVLPHLFARAERSVNERAIDRYIKTHLKTS